MIPCSGASSSGPVWCSRTFPPPWPFPLPVQLHPPPRHVLACFFCLGSRCHSSPPPVLSESSCEWPELMAPWGHHCLGDRVDWCLASHAPPAITSPHLWTQTSPSLVSHALLLWKSLLLLWTMLPLNLRICWPVPYVPPWRSKLWGFSLISPALTAP